MKLLILHLVHYSVRIPPFYYGGSERIAWWLAEYQVKLRNYIKNYFKKYFPIDDVIIGIVGVLDIEYLHKTKRLELLLYDASNTVKKIPVVAKDWHYMVRLSTLPLILTKEMDIDMTIVHNHVLQRNSWIIPLILGSLNKYTKTMSITTLHYDPPLIRAMRPFNFIVSSSRGLLVAISKSQYNRLKKVLGRSLLTYVHNGIPVDKYPFSKHKSDFLLYLGAIHPLKGPHIAIRIARRSKLKLYLVGPIRDYTYFNTYIKPYLGDNILYLGEVDEKTKLELLSEAKALLFPVQREEYFGLAVVEAMACGTPVITFARGAMPEIVVHGVTGFLARNICEMFKYIKSIDNIDPNECRRHVEEKFSSKHMCLRYVLLYTKLMSFVRK